MLQFEITSIKIPSDDERIEEIRNNKYLHPWTKLNRIVRIYRRQQLMAQWTIETDQKIEHFYGLNVFNQLTKLHKKRRARG